MGSGQSPTARSTGSLPAACSRRSPRRAQLPDQDHLHALLRLHFDDVREEEWAPSYGGSRTRMDFLLKRARMVVETKMTRDRLDQAKVVDELVIDKAHYRQAPGLQDAGLLRLRPRPPAGQPRRARERRQRKRERLDDACDRGAPAEFIRDENAGLAGAFGI